MSECNPAEPEFRCFAFHLSAVYEEPGCIADGALRKVTLVVRGREPHGAEHECTWELRDAVPMEPRLEFCEDSTSGSFKSRPAGSTCMYSLDGYEEELVFYVRKLGGARAGRTFVTCTFHHRSSPNNEMHSHRVQVALALN